jgi:hypothetical protein
VKPPIPGFDLDTSLLTVDSATSRTDQRIVKGALAVDSQATLSGVRLVGGLIRIGSIRSVSHVDDDGAGKRTPNADLEVSGVTVAGLPAQITEDGLVVGAPGGGQGPLAQQVQSQVNKLLLDFGVKVSLLPVEEATEEGAATASVGGVLVEFERDVQDLPTVPGPLGDADPNGVYRGSFVLGNTAALGGVPVIPADPEVEDVVPELPVDSGLEGGTGDLGGGGDLAGGGGSDLGVDSGVGAPVDDTATTTPVESDAGGGEELAAPEEEQAVGFVDDLFADRLPLLYLAFTLAALGLCLAPRLTLPARLPANR